MPEKRRTFAEIIARLRRSDPKRLTAWGTFTAQVVYAFTEAPVAATRANAAAEAANRHKGRKLDLLRLWKLFSFILSRRTRERVFEPAYQDMLADHLESKKYRTKWARRWLTFCFALRTVLMVGDCLRAVAADKALIALARMIPEPLRRWWLMW